MNLYPISILENFYEDPDAVRKFALSQKYQYRHQLKSELPFVFPESRTKDLSVINLYLSWLREKYRHFSTTWKMIISGGVLQPTFNVLVKSMVEV